MLLSGQGMEYIGCYTDSYYRILSDNIFNGYHMTTTECVKECTKRVSSKDHQ